MEPSTGTPADLIAPILGTGLVGVFFILVVNHIWLVSRKTHDLLMAEKDAQITHRDRLLLECQQAIKDRDAVIANYRSITEDKIIPALVDVSRITAEYAAEKIVLSRRRDTD